MSWLLSWFAAVAWFIASAYASIAEEVEGPIREVSPEEFHKLSLRQIEHEEPNAKKAKGKGKKGKKALLDQKAEEETKPKKKKKNWEKDWLSPEEKASKKEAWLKGKDQRQAKNNEQRHQAEEEEIAAMEAAKKEAQLKETIKEEKVEKEVETTPEKKKEDEGFDLKNLLNLLPGEKEKREKKEQAKQEKIRLKKEAELKAVAQKEAAEKHSAEIAKANKTYACRDAGGKGQVLVMYLNSLGAATSKYNKEKEKCIKTQLNQHCMPYESFDVTPIMPCAEGNTMCLQQRVMDDHKDCLNRNVDWESIKSYSTNAGKDMMTVLGEWCTHIKAFKEVVRRAKLDDTFIKEYPAILILEDHVLLDKEWLEEVTKDWVHNSPRMWDMVQFDSYGGKSNQDKIGEFRGKQIYRPSWKANYGGSHALLIRTASTNTLLEKMQSLNIVPFEWIGKSMNDDPKGLEILSWDAGVSTVKWQSSPYLREYFLPEGQCKRMLEEAPEENKRRR